MGSGGGSDSPYPWGREVNYWGWVDRRARMLHDCPYCGAVKGDPCVTVTSNSGVTAIIGTYTVKPHADRTLPVEKEARELRAAHALRDIR